MSIDQSMQNLCDIVGLIVDRAATPEKVVGQACLISQNRMVTTATSVFKYKEAPWALAVNFPHPDLTYGVKSITLHPTFNTTEAHWTFLSATGSPQDAVYFPDNDIAILEVEARLKPLDSQLSADLNMNLSQPVPVMDEDMYAGMRGEDTAFVIKKAIAAGQDGLLTFVDARNIPTARLEFAGGNIKRAIYKQLAGEVSLFELVYRKPAGSFYFQSTSNFGWPNIRPITAPADNLLGEAILRSEQIMPIIHALGGPDARYQRVAGQFDTNLVSQNLRWVAERLWANLDGYLSIDKLSERVGADSFSVVQALQEMFNQHLVDIYRKNPFARTGQIGMPIVPVMDVNMDVWDPLDAFYLDPLSGRPVSQQGNFFGPSRLIDTKVLLHTVPVPSWAYGSMILREGHLVGLYTGLYNPKLGQAAPPQRLFRMVWVSAIEALESEQAVKNIAEEKSAKEAAAAAKKIASQTATQQEAEAQLSEAGQMGRFICAHCKAKNAQVGICRNCGVDMEEAALGIDPAEKLENAKRLRNTSQTTTGLKPIHTWGPVAVIVVIVLVIYLTGRPKAIVSKDNSGDTSQSETQMKEPSATADGSDSAEKTPVVSMKSVISEAGLKSSPPSKYSYEDTLSRTTPLKSFGLSSKSENQKLLFIVWDAPVTSVEELAHRVPFADLIMVKNLKDVQVAKGQVTVAGDDMNWFVGLYKHKFWGGDQLAMVGTYRAPRSGKTIVVVAQPFSNTDTLDYMKSLSVVEAMASSKIGSR